MLHFGNWVIKCYFKMFFPSVGFKKKDCGCLFAQRLILLKGLNTAADL